MIPDPLNPRYSSRPFPSYSYVPGSGTPHPVSDPRGHMYGLADPEVETLDPHEWHTSETYLYAIDLFNHCYFWEAHEAWEALWHAAGREGTVGAFLKGLIKLAAAGVKQLEGNSAGVARHARRASELLDSISASTYCGLELASLRKNAEHLVTDPSANVAPLLLALPRP